MISGNGLAKTKLVEQLNLVTPQTAHHGSTSPRIASSQWNHASRPVSTDFCNKICQKRTFLPGMLLVIPAFQMIIGSAAPVFPRRMVAYPLPTKYLAAVLQRSLPVLQIS